MRCSIPACRGSDGAITRIARTRHTGPPATGFFLFLFFFGTPMQVPAAMAILANAMVGHGGVPELYNLKPVLNSANVCSPNTTSDSSTNYDSFLN